MQKRLLALVATVAMVLSMFAGVAFAESVYEIKLSKTTVISSGDAVDYELITGTVIKDGALATDVTRLTVTDQPEVPVSKGRFSFYLPTNIRPTDLTVKAYEGETEVATTTLKIRYNVTTTPEKLEFAYTGTQNPVAITGKVTTSKGEPVVGAIIRLDGKTHSHYFGDGVVVTNSKGEFGYVVLKWEVAEALTLTVSDPVENPANEKRVPHLFGKVTPKTATLEITPNSGIVRTIAPTTFTIKGSGFEAGKQVTFSLERDGENVSPSDEPLPPTATTLTNENGKINVTWTWTPDDAGTYTLTATAGNYTASTTFVVVNPANYNLLNASELTKLEVTDTNTFVFGGSDSGNIRLVNAHNLDETGFKYTVYVDGKLAKETVSDTPFENKTSGTLVIAAKKLGQHTVRVVVKNAADQQVFDQTYTATVKGWDVTVDVTELVVNKVYTLTLVVKDVNGNPVNNAYVTLSGAGVSASIDPTTKNIQNGVYVFENIKAIQPGGKVDVVLTTRVPQDMENPKDMAKLSLNVVGEKVYNVTSNVSALLQGKEQEVELTVTRDGAAVQPWSVKWIYADGAASVPVIPNYVDGISKVKINAAKAGTMTIRVENIDGTLCGETTVEVVAPKLVLVDEETVYLTNNFKTTVKFKIVDPRDGSVIKDNVTINRGTYVPDTVEYYDANGAVTGNILLGAEEHVVTILPKVTAANWQAAKDAEKTVMMTLEVGGITVDGGFEVKDATIVSNPEMIIIGAKNNLTLTYLDANGKPIVGRTVKVDGGADLGKTDEKGQVIYPAGVVAQPVTVKAATETNAEVSKTIKIGYDFEAPQVTYEVDGNKATLVITDNVRLVRINIDGKDIDFWPGARYEHVVTLNPGVNKVRVKAQDSNDNVLDEVVEIEYKTDSIVLKDDKVQRQGDYLFVQARQFEEFGAKFAWNGETRTATFVIGDDKVEVTIGSTTAVVNGEAVTMPVAAFIADGRTYVPVRFVSENLGWNVHWAQGDIVTIALP